LVVVVHKAQMDQTVLRLEALQQVVDMVEITAEGLGIVEVLVVAEAEEAALALVLLARLDKETAGVQTMALDPAAEEVREVLVPQAVVGQLQMHTEELVLP
jgi:23S rRNA-/tRNA-specific pseudouridylate synthase